MFYICMCEKKETTSQYKGVYWHKQSGKWRVQMSSKGNFKYGGMFENEVNADTDNPLIFPDQDILNANSQAKIDAAEVAPLIDEPILPLLIS